MSPNLYFPSCSWMRDYPMFHIRHFTLPGTHNSACYDFPSNMVSKVYKSAAKCQSETIIMQLLMGVRYFDIRIREENGDFWIGHTFVTNITLVDVLWSMKIFCSWFKSEVLVLDLDFEHLPNGVGENKINWNMVAYLIRELYHGEDWKQVDLDICKRGKRSKFKSKFVYLEARRKASSNIPSEILDEIYGKNRLKFELWWSTIVKKYRVNRSILFPELPADICVPQQFEHNPIGELVDKGHQIVLLCEFLPSNLSWNTNVKLKSWPSTLASDATLCKDLWINFCKLNNPFSHHKAQEKQIELNHAVEKKLECELMQELQHDKEEIQDIKWTLWTHLNCVLTLPQTKSTVVGIFVNGFANYYKQCNPILIDLLKSETFDTSSLQIVDCDFISQEICNLLIGNNRKRLHQLFPNYKDRNDGQKSDDEYSLVNVHSSSL